MIGGRGKVSSISIIQRMNERWTRDVEVVDRRGSRSTASGSTAKSFLFFFRTLRQSRKEKFITIVSIPFLFFFFGLHGATNFFYSIGFLYFAPPPRPPLYFFFSGHVKIFARRLCDNRRRHRTTSLYIFFSSFRLLLPPPTPYHTFATTLLFIF